MQDSIATFQVEGQEPLDDFGSDGEDTDAHPQHDRVDALDHEPETTEQEPTEDFALQ